MAFVKPKLTLKEAQALSALAGEAAEEALDVLGDPHDVAAARRAMSKLTGAISAHNERERKKREAKESGETART